MQHITERDWKPTERGLAISITLEAAELLEHFQWDDYQKREDQAAIAEELADIVIYILQFAHKRQIAIGREVLAKLKKSAKKYPVGQTAEEHYRAKIAARHSKA